MLFLTGNDCSLHGQASVKNKMGPKKNGTASVSEKPLVYNSKALQLSEKNCKAFGT